MKSKVTRKFQVTIPKKIRELLDIKVGDTVVWEIDEKGFVVLKKDEIRSSLKNFIGVWSNNPLIKRFKDSVTAVRWLRGHEDND